MLHKKGGKNWECLIWRRKNCRSYYSYFQVGGLKRGVRKLLFCISLGKEKKFVLCGGWSIGSFDNLTKKKNRLIPQKMHLYKQKIGTYQ